MKSFLHAGEQPVSSPSALRTPDSLLRFQRCPYCRSGHGDIFVDLDQAAALPRDTDVLIGQDPEQSVVLFRPGVVGGNPCPHTVFLLIDVILTARKKPTISHCFTWRHTWFDESDPGGRARDLMMDVLEEAVLDRESRHFPGPRAKRSCFPFWVLRPSLEVPNPHRADPKGLITCEGWVICSVSGRGFCQDLAKAAR